MSLDLGGPGVTALVGPNGAGKTTVIRIMAGLLAPDSGVVTLDGVPLADIPPRRRARRIAYVSQSWRPAFSFTVEQTVLFGRAPWHGIYGGYEEEEDLRAAEAGIELMELDGLRNAPVTELSGGELQRVMIAMALAQEADYLLLDEPTTHLDVAHQQSVLRNLVRLVPERKIAVLASLHDLNLASIYSDRIVAMRDGTIVADGDPSEVLTPETLRRTFRTELHVDPGLYRRGPGVRFPDDRRGEPAGGEHG